MRLSLGISKCYKLIIMLCEIKTNKRSLLIWSNICIFFFCPKCVLNVDVLLCDTFNLL